MRLKKLFFLSLLVGNLANAKLMAPYETVQSQEPRSLSQAEIIKTLACTPQLISRYPKVESERAALGTVKTGNLVFQRTDVLSNSSEGELVVATNEKNPRKVLMLNLNLNEKIFYSAQLGLLVLEGASGSGVGYELYELNNQGSLFIGATDESSSANLYLKAILEQKIDSVAKCQL